jgi:alkylhydroperoxidase/carboxymuconolactone decarboxylase family protein YurZ
VDDEQRRAAGLARRRAVLGEAHVERALAESSGAAAEFQDLITRYAWGEIWTRPGLALRDRRILVLGTLLALGRFDELRMHAAAALAQGGLSREELGELLLQQTVYCGVPAVRTAFEALRELLAPPRPL